MSISKNVCLIPAKSASTRLLKKNILKIAGKELLYYPIRAAKDAGLFGEHIYVSTESEEISQIAERYGAVAHMRDAKLAHDPFGVADVTLEFLDRNSVYKTFHNITILLPTSPMILAQDVINAFRVYTEGGFKYLMSVAESGHNAFRSVLLKNGEIEPLFTEQIRKKSQELDKTYSINGAVTIMNVEDFLMTKDYFTFPLGAYVMPIERSIDIDTEFDYKLAKIMMESAAIKDGKAEQEN